jgi:hypothetical protein
MPSSSDKWVRSLKDNPAGKVVADPVGNRWEWQADDETARLLNKLDNAELAIERTDIRLNRQSAAGKSAAPWPSSEKAAGRLLKPGARDSGGGFNPYDHSGKPKRR